MTDQVTPADPDDRRTPAFRAARFGQVPTAYRPAGLSGTITNRRSDENNAPSVQMSPSDSTFKLTADDKAKVTEPVPHSPIKAAWLASGIAPGRELARDQADALDTELARDVLLRRPLEAVVPRRDHHIHEPGPLHDFELLCARQSAGNSTGP